MRQRFKQSNRTWSSPACLSIGKHNSRHLKIVKVPCGRRDLHSQGECGQIEANKKRISDRSHMAADTTLEKPLPNNLEAEDRKSTRLNSSHGYISYAVFCLKKKKK